MVPIFLVWMYLSWSVILFGAVLSASVTEWRSSRGRRHDRFLDPGRRLLVASHILAILFEASLSGKSVRPTDLKVDPYPGEDAMERLLSDLRAAGFAEETTGGHWVVSRDLATVSLFDFVTVLGLKIDLPDADPSSAVLPWRGGLANAVATAAQGQRQALSVPLRDLLAGEARDSEQNEAQPLPLRRAP